jgi:hypothetical protein
MDFLVRILELLKLYFKEDVNEKSVKENFTLVYQVLLFFYPYLSILLLPPASSLLLLFNFAPVWAAVAALIMRRQLLDEMMDGGFPICTEPNVLMDIVRPRNLAVDILDKVLAGRMSHSIYSFIMHTI